MNTKVKNWHIVFIYDKDQSVGRVLWGICTQDMASRFSVGDYVCTSRIIEIIPKENLVKTFSGNAYLVEGDGKKSQIQVQDFELLRGGLSPDEISFLTEEQKMELVKLRFSDLESQKSHWEMENQSPLRVQELELINQQLLEACKEADRYLYRSKIQAAIRSTKGDNAND